MVSSIYAVTHNLIVTYSDNELNLDANEYTSNICNTIISAMEVEPEHKRIIAGTGGSAIFACTAIGESSTVISWRKRASDYTDETKTYTDLYTFSSQPGDWDPVQMTVKSYLTLNDLSVDDTHPNYECYVDFMELSSEMELDVVGE